MNVFYDTFPALMRHLFEVTDLWISNVERVANRLRHDKSQLKDAFDFDVTQIQSIQADLGDRHAGCQSVALLEDARGSRILYKPTSQATAIGLIGLFEWSRSLGGPSAVVPSTIDVGDYGYQAWIDVEAEPSDNDAYFNRLGQLHALCAVLGSYDLHGENVFRYGDEVALLDVETMLSPVLKPRTGDGPAYFPSAIDNGILANLAWSFDDDSAGDISVMGRQPGQVVRRNIPWSAHANATNLDYDEATLDVVLPTSGRWTDPRPFRQSFMQGFDQTAAWIVENKQELSAQVVKRFGETFVRALLRPTRQYAALVFDCSHPQLAHDLLAREAHLGHVCRGESIFDVVVDYEVDSLLQGDIPNYTVVANSRSLTDGRGISYPGLIALSPVEHFMTNLRDFNVVSERRIVECSFEAFDRTNGGDLVVGGHVAHPVSHMDLGKLQGPAPADAALLVGQRLLELVSVKSAEGHLGWHDFETSASGSFWRVAPTNNYYYKGESGILVAFIALAEVHTKSAGFKDMRDRLLERWRTRIRKVVPRHGGFIGIGGDVAVLEALIRTTAADDHSEDLKLITQGAAIMNETDDLDVISGLAGTLVALTKLARFNHNVGADTLPLEARVLSSVQQLINYTHSGYDCGQWLTIGSRPLASYSHGCSGIALSLLRARNWVSPSIDRQILETVSQSSAWQQTLKSQGEGWLDQRLDDETVGPPLVRAGAPRYPSNWCHGSVGIGMARLAELTINPCADASMLAADVEAAFQHVIREGFGWGHSLCHGDAGALDFLLLAQSSGLSSAAAVHSAAARLAGHVVDKGGRTDNGITTVETPGLLNGAAGVAYELLRVDDPIYLPSLLA